MTMWYENKGDAQDVVLSTKACVVRNLKGFKFVPQLTKEEVDELHDEVAKIIDRNEFPNYWNREKENFSNLAPEAQLFGRKGQLLDDKVRKCIYFNDDASLSVSVGSGEHMIIKALASGKNPDVVARAENVARDIEKKTDVAFSQKYGFLTSDISLTGTGLKLLYTVAIPAIAKSAGVMRILKQRAEQYNWNIYAFSERPDLADSCVYVVTNNDTLGVSEADTLQRGEELINNIIQLERSLRGELKNKLTDKLRNDYGRAYGILRYTYRIDRHEAIDRINELRIYKEYDDTNEFNLSWRAINTIAQELLWHIDMPRGFRNVDNALNRASRIKEILKGDDVNEN